MIDRPQPAGRERLDTIAVQLFMSIALVVVSFLQPLTLCAQSPQDTALARSLFDEGVQAADAQDWAKAANRFERAYSVKPTPGIAYNWACALAELGKVVEASERLRVVTLDPATPPELRGESELKLKSIVPRIAAVVAHVEARSNDLVVLLDGRALSRAAWGSGSPSDPGPHTLSLMRGDQALATETFELTEGERREVTLYELTGPAPGAATFAPTGPDGRPARDEPADSKPWFKRRWVLWTALGTVVVASAVTTTLLLTRDDPKAPAPVKGDTTPAVIRW